MGRRAGVRTIVLTHLLPGYEPPDFGDDVQVATDLAPYEVAT